MVWGKPAAGAWADNVEEEEAAGTLGPPPAVFPALGPKDDDFPSLGLAATVKESKKDRQKKAQKGQKLSLTDFLKTDVGGSGAAPMRRGGDIDLASLPTAPRQRVEGEERPERGLGGGFREYGGGRDGGRGRFDDERRPRHGEEEDMGPSKADMSDNWGADRKFVPGGPADRGRGGFGGGGGFREGGFREGGFRDGGGFRGREGSRDREGLPEGPSRADEVDDWGKTKQFVPSSSGRGGFEDRPRGGGGGFEDRPRGGGGFRERSPMAFREPSRADTEERWGRSSGADFKPTAFEDRPRREFEDRPPRRGGFGFGDRDTSRDASRDRRERTPRDASRDVPGSRDLSQERSWRRTQPLPPAGGDEAPAAGAPPRERPRLNLAPRTAPASGAAAPSAGASKASVFGAARPREEVLREQGRDAAKEDLSLEHAAVDRPETAEEKQLKQEITNLQVRVEAGEADAEYEGEGEGGEGEGQEGEEAAAGKTVAQALEDLEARLQKLQLELDAKAKYARAADDSRERPAARREASPAEGGWRRPGPEASNGAAPRGFRDARPVNGAGFEDRPPRRAGGGGGGGGAGFEERGRRDNFPPRDRDASRDSKPRW